MTPERHAPASGRVLAVDLAYKRHRDFGVAVLEPGERAAVECLPLSAWRALRLAHLPAKSRCKPPSLAACRDSLVDAGLLQRGAEPSHDQLQALVAGLGGLALAAGHASGYRLSGVPPFVLDGTWREGFIIDPLRPGATAG